MRGRRKTWSYALASLVATGVGVAAAGGGSEPAAGALGAWAIQAVSFWAGGIVARMGGLIVTGGLAVAGPAGAGLPIAYGIAMLGLLLLEAAWLARSPKPVRKGPGSKDSGEIEGMSSTG